MLDALLGKMASVAVPAALLSMTTAYAHSEGIVVPTEFAAGFSHPFSGVDHMLAMVAVGWWATQNQRRAVWILPLAFSMMLMAGLILGIAGINIPIVESGIAVSLVALGLLIAFAVRLPVGTAAGLIGAFALLHGHAHGGEMPRDVSFLTFALGLLLTTLVLHVAGVLAGRLVLSDRVARIGGAAVAAAGGWLLAFA